jgi:hypothetical protein
LELKVPNGYKTKEPKKTSIHKKWRKIKTKEFNHTHTKIEPKPKVLFNKLLT